MQLVSAPDCGSGYHGFESHYPPFFFFIGLSPSGKAQDFDSCTRGFESRRPSTWESPQRRKLQGVSAGFSSINNVLHIIL